MTQDMNSGINQFHRSALMKPRFSRVCGLLAGICIAPLAIAEDYDFEVDLSFDSSSFDGSRTITTPGGTIFNSANSDADDLSASGRWYFSGLSDAKGPKARAALTSRASFLGFAYLRSDSSTSSVLTSTDPSFPVPPGSLDASFETQGDTFAVDARYVDRDSGWFGSVGLLTSDTELSSSLLPSSSSFDGTGWRLGAGKYLFENTTLGIEFGQIDADNGGDAELVAVTFEHLGEFGQTWQYAVEIGFNQLDSGGGFEVDTWSAALALYPTPDFEFGLALEDQSAGSIGEDATSIGAFASWFVAPNVKLSANYRVDDVDYLGNVAIGGATTVSNADQDSFGISATVRF
jgi:hypothetical protein